MNDTIIIHDSRGRNFFHCSFKESTGIIEAEWVGNMMEMEPAKRAAMAITNMLVETGAMKVLDDNRQGLGPWPDFMDWLANEWLPSLTVTRLTDYAHVLSKDMFAKEPAYSLFNQSISGVDFVTFDSYQSAMDWLKRSPELP